MLRILHVMETQDYWSANASAVVVVLHSARGAGARRLATVESADRGCASRRASVPASVRIRALQNEGKNNHSSTRKRAAAFDKD